MLRKKLEDLETVAHDARLQFVKHELQRGLEWARMAVVEQSNGNHTVYDHCKAKAVKTHDDFSAYLSAISASLTTSEEEELQMGLLALRAAVDALD